MAIQQRNTPVAACRAVQCPKCGKTTWAGCGQHIDAVMASVKEEDQCKCEK